MFYVLFSLIPLTISYFSNETDFLLKYLVINGTISNLLYVLVIAMDPLASKFLLGLLFLHVVTVYCKYGKKMYKSQTNEFLI